MATNTAITYLFLQLIHVSTYFSTVAEKQMCAKIVFQNINEYEMPWIQVEGVYKLFSTNEGFPVYLNAASNLFFYYNNDATRGIKILTFGEKIGSFFGLLGLLPASFDPKAWLAAGNVNKNDVFGDAITSWKYYSPLEKTFKDIPRKVRAVCVDEDTVRCSSGKVYLNDVITGPGARVLNDPRSDFFGKLPGVYSEIRPVFKHNKQNWYLYYRNGYWWIGTSYSGAGKQVFRVPGQALRPEFLTQRWEKWTGTRWEDVGGELRVLCRGISHGKNMCRGWSTCNKHGSCVYTKGNETVCVCSDTAYGSYCEETRGCADPGIPSSGVDTAWRGTRPGDITTLFCKARYRSVPVEFYVCEGSDVKTWLLESKASCQAQEPTSPKTVSTYNTSPAHPRSQTTEKPWDKSLDFLIFFGPCLAFQLVVPCFTWLGLIIANLVRACRRTPSRSPERIDAIGKIQKGKYQKLFRVYSGFFNFAFWPWLCFVCACGISADLRGTHENLFYCAIGMCFFCAVFVAIEAFFCRERVALQNIVTCEYIKFLQTVPPVIEMEVERFDWRQVQSAGYRTNPTTGNWEYREAIHRKIGRKFVREPFVFDAWSDHSDRGSSFEGELTMIHLNLEITLDDDTTSVSFEEQKEALIRKTDNLNRFYTFLRKDSVPNFREFIILCSDTGSLPFWMKEEYFWYATFLQLSWMYRWFLASKINFSEYTVRKKVLGNRGVEMNGDEPNNHTASPSQDNHNDFDRFPEQAESRPNAPLIDGRNERQKNYMTI